MQIKFSAVKIYHFPLIFIQLYATALLL